MTGIVERLRDLLKVTSSPHWHDTMKEAADEIERLREERDENERAIAVWRGRTQRAEAERDAAREALRDLLADTQHARHACGDSDCPVARARAVLENGR